MDVGRRVGDLFSQLGMPLDVVSGRLQKLEHGSLNKLRSRADDVALESSKFGPVVIDGRANIPPFGYNPPPNDVRKSIGPFVRATYSSGNDVAQSSASDPFPGLMDPRRKRATELTMLVQSDTNVRSSFERVAGGRVVPDGRVDGTLNMIPGESVNVGALNTQGSAGYAGGTPNSIYELLAALDTYVMEQAQALVPGRAQNMFELEVGVGSLLESEGGSGSRLGSGGENEGEEGEDTTFSSGGLSGLGEPRELLEPTGEGNTDSVDTGTLRLKRLMDKREQMYDVYRQTYDKYNQSARAAVDNLKA